MRSGMHKLPNVFQRPLWRDSFFWAFLGTLAFWALVLWLIFG